MMIFGVAYHVIPRFTGYPLHNRRAAGAHWWISNLGLALMVCGFVERVARPGAGTVVLAIGGTLSALGAYIFAYLIWRTVDGPVRVRKDDQRANHVANSGSGRALPIA
jgi:cbb3-type cytochrome oxidase subunit 1